MPGKLIQPAVLALLLALPVAAVARDQGSAAAQANNPLANMTGFNQQFLN